MSNTTLSRFSLSIYFVPIVAALLAAATSGIVVANIYPTAIFGAIALTLAATICWVKPKLYIQCLFLIGLVLPAGFTTTQIFSVNIGNYNLLFTDIMVALVLVRWMFEKLTKRVGIRFSKQLTISVVVMTGWAIFSAVRGLLQYSGNANIVFYDVRPVFYYIVVLIAADLAGDKEDIKLLSKNLILGSVLYSGFLLSYFIIPNNHPLTPIMQLSGWASVNRVGFTNGDIFLMVIPMILLIIVGKDRTILEKTILWAVLILITVVLVLSMSRVTFLLMPISVLLSLALYSQRKQKGLRWIWFATHLFLLVIIFVVVITLTVFVFPWFLGSSAQNTLEIFLGRFDLSSESSQEVHILPRLVMIRTAAELILHNPILGYGFGFQFRIDGWEVPVTFIDNSWFTAWIRLGIIGITCLGNLVILFARSVNRLLAYPKQSRDEYSSTFLISLAGSGIPLLIHSLNNSWLISSTAILPMLIIVGAVISYSEKCRRKI